MVRVNIIESGSSGNCVIYNDEIMVDCGISFKKIKENCDYKKIKLLFISHIHGDHFNKTSIKRLAKERPTLRFAVGSFLVNDLLECGVNKRNIDVIEIGQTYDYGKFKIIPISLYHDTPNFGIRLFIKESDYKIFHATDTRTLEGITAKNYNFYGIEANYLNDEELSSRTDNNYYYERVRNTHLSREQTIEWLLENMSDESQHHFMHEHKDRS